MGRIIEPEPCGKQGICEAFAPVAFVIDIILQCLRFFKSPWKKIVLFFPLPTSLVATRQAGRNETAMAVPMLDGVIRDEALFV